MSLNPLKITTYLPIPLRDLLIGLIILSGLALVGQSNYLLYHTLAELFSIVIAFTIFVLAWNARRILNNQYLLFVGFSFGFVAVIDLLHTLAYKGMTVIPGTGLNDPNAANLATQLWLAARYLQAASLAAAPLFLRRTVSPRLLVAIFTLVTGLLLLSIFAWQIFPVAFTDSAGITGFKRTSEYVIISLLFISLFGLLSERHVFDRDVVALLVTSICATILAELAFTGYLAVTDLVNMFGHMLKIIAFFLAYKAIIEMAFIRPQELLYRDLALSSQALSASEQRERARSAQLEAIMEAVPAVVWIALDPQARQVTGNRAAADLLKMPPNANQSLTAADDEAPAHFKVLDKDGRELSLEELPLQRGASGAPVRDFEETIVFENGETRNMLGNVTPLVDEEGRPAGAVAAFIDITERARAEQALAESERLYRGLFASMAEGFSIHEVIYDEQGEALDFTFEEANPAFERSIDLKPALWKGKTAGQIYQSVDHSWLDRFAQVDRTGEAMRFEDFSPLFNKYFDVVLYSLGNHRVAALSSDVTERRRSQQALKQSEARLRRLIDSNIIGIIYADSQGQVTTANDAFLEMIGYTRADFDTGLVNWMNLTPPEYRLLDEHGIAEANERGACTPYEKEYVRKDGSRLPILIGYAYFPDPIAPYICFIVDLTQQKRAEEAVKEYATQLERSNRELQNFAFVASHDLQEPLRKIQAFGDRLNARMRDQLDDESSDYLARMLKASLRMRTMINDLLSLSRVTTQARPFKRVELGQVAAEVLSDLEPQLERTGGQVEVAELPQVEADPLQMQQLLQNLISNALKFHRPDEPPRVRVYSECPPENQHVIIYVEDNGVGFEEQYRERIFEPFQRLYGMGQFEGSGIGLAICRKIVERHFGDIRATSTPGQGSKFIVTLPVRQPSRREGSL